MKDDPKQMGVAAKRESERTRRDSITVSVDAEAHLQSLELDATLMPGARNAIRDALGVRAEDRVLLVIGKSHEAVGAALLAAARELQVTTRTYLVDLVDSRSEPFMKRLEMRMDEADATILVGDPAEMAQDFRRRVCVRPGRRRHAHMIGITEEMMRQSMRVDYAEVHSLGERLRDSLGRARKLTVVSGPASRLAVELDPQARWHNGSGWLRKPGFTNLPGGEVVTCPASATGRFHADGGVWLPDGTQVRGLTFEFREGRVVRVIGRGSERVEEVINGDDNGRRVGQVAFGTNIGVLTPIGAMLQDLKMPGLHLVLGYSCPEQTGATWTSNVIVAVLCRRPDVAVDGEPIMVRGRYAQHLL